MCGWGYLFSRKNYILFSANPSADVSKRNGPKPLTWFGCHISKSFSLQRDAPSNRALICNIFSKYVPHMALRNSKHWVLIAQIECNPQATNHPRNWWIYHLQFSICRKSWKYILDIHQRIPKTGLPRFINRQCQSLLANIEFFYELKMIPVHITEAVMFGFFSQMFWFTGIYLKH